jgi:hypothetical protein
MTPDHNIGTAKGVRMNRCVLLACTALSLSGSTAQGGNPARPNMPVGRNATRTAEQERLQKCWDDYYQALRRCCQQLDHIKWVAYYKDHGYRLASGCAARGAPCGGARIPYAPVFSSPQMQWAVPGCTLGGPPRPVPAKTDKQSIGSPPQPAKQSRAPAGARPSPDDFELFLEGVLERPRGPGPRPAAGPAANVTSPPVVC